jgi:predicted metal-binding membrane protein
VRPNRIHAIRGFGRVAGRAARRVARWGVILAAGALVVWLAFAVPDLGLWAR